MLQLKERRLVSFLRLKSTLNDSLKSNKRLARNRNKK